VYIEAGLLSRLGELCARHLPDRRVAIISDERVALAIAPPIDAPHFTFAAGESSKSRESWAQLTDALLGEGFGRDSAIVSLGGGVTGDLAGFVAATYLRGIPWLQVPTTLLAMLDASVGGKTGVDTPAGKNLVGAFHQPVAVVMDPDVLRSLPLEDLRNGLAEAVKHAAILDADHFAWLGASVADILASEAVTIESLLRRNVAIKASVVQADEREGGRRAILNAGHTIGHAVEHASGFSLSHGEAVAIGLVAEARLGERLGVTEAGTAAKLASLFEGFGLPVRVPRALDAETSSPRSATTRKIARTKSGLCCFSCIGAVNGSEAMAGQWRYRKACSGNR
jgi:3-dehydroquinate synthase